MLMLYFNKIIYISQCIILLMSSFIYKDALNFSKQYYFNGSIGEILENPTIDLAERIPPDPSRQ
jgi:hypothetical protein